MAEGWLRHMHGERFNVYSAGIETHGLNPNAVKVMAEAGVDISNHRSQLLSEFADQPLDYVITVCGHANESCPFFPGDTKVIHVGFDDPPKLALAFEDEDSKLDCYRKVRDEIREFVSKIDEVFNEF
jgi:arsenate reductase